MQIDAEKKKKLKKILYAMSDEGEREQYSMREIAAMMEQLQELLSVMTAHYQESVELGVKSPSLEAKIDNLTRAFLRFKVPSNDEHFGSMIQRLDQLNKKSYPDNKETNSILMKVNEGFSVLGGQILGLPKEFASVWRWPQYQKTGLRDKSFKDINPATEDKQPALGTAGTPSADVITVQGRAGMTPLDVNATITPAPLAALTPAAPTSATVGVTSALAVAANTSRKGLVLTNTSNNTISLGFGANAAVLNSGITLTPNGVWVLDEFTYTTQAVNAIASGATSNLSIQEYS